jgi:predicted ABC-type ATPase
LYDYLVQIRAFHAYYHINPDVIARDLAVSLNFDNWPFDFSFVELENFLDASAFQPLVGYSLSGLLDGRDRTVALKAARFGDVTYLAAALAEFLRVKMLQADSSFSFESVFSHPSKIKEMEDAKRAGFKVYLYFISTSDPFINLQRVKNRAESGGHDVPDEKVSARYTRTMGNLYAAFNLADRAYLFDNSAQKANDAFDFFAEKNGKRVYVSDSAPQWFGEYLLKYLAGI